MAKDFAGELVERDANFLDVENRVAGDFATAAQVGGRREWEQAQGRGSQTVDLDTGEAGTFVDPALSNAANAGRIGGLAGAHSACDDCTTTFFAAPVAVQHLNGLARSIGILVANGLVTCDVIRVSIDREDFGFAIAEAGQSRVEIDDLCDDVRREGRRGEGRQNRHMDDERDAPSLHQVTQPDATAAPGPKLG